MTNDELLKDEYLAVQKSIDDFDGKMLIIKAWSVTLSAAGLSLAYVEDEPAILLIASVSAVVFWFIEALWKVLQRAHYPRLEQIEAHFSPGKAKTKPFQIGRVRKEQFSGTARTWVATRALGVLFWPHVMLPHAVVAGGGMLLFAFARP